MTSTRKSVVDRSVDAALEGVPLQLLFGGRWQPAADGSAFAVEDPSTGETLCEVADAGADDARAALAALWEAQRDWHRTAPRERGEILRRVYEGLTERADRLALLMTLEMGKPLAESRAEIGYAAEFFRWFAEEAVRIEGRLGVSPNGANRTLVTPQPVGPSVLITPWNFPMAMGARKIAPAMAAGCTTIIKPAQQTPLSTLALAALLKESGLPPGVLSVLTTTKPGEVVGPLLKDHRIRKLSFTGSTEVGRRLLQEAADNVLRVSMELGGNAPFIVCADADLEAALDGAMLAKMRNMGEACTAANRFYVERPIYDEFVERFAERMSRLRMGRGTEEGVEVGPLVDRAAVDKVEGLVREAVAAGAKPVVGGQSSSSPGYFYEPTVLTDVPENVSICHEEIFGPVAPVSAFDNDDDVLVAANSTHSGLVAYAYTSDLQRGMRFVEEVETGMMGLNRGLVSDPTAPFGGVKHSGLGREGSHEGIEEFLDLKYVAMPR